MKKNVLVIYGGKSCEHDISILTGIQVLNNINRDFYNVIPVYISKAGVFYTGKNLEDLEVYQKFNPLSKNIKAVSLISGKPYLIENSLVFIENQKELMPQLFAVTV